MICLHFVRGELPTLGIYNTDTSREIDRLSRDKLSMPPVMKGILCIKFDKKHGFLREIDRLYRATNYQCRQF